MEKLLEHESLDRADVEALLEHGVMAAELAEQQKAEAPAGDDTGTPKPVEAPPKAERKPERGAIPPGLPEPGTP